MNKIFYLLCVPLALGACQEQQVTTSLTTDNGLRIIEFIEDGTNETSDFSGFIFVFNEDGSVVANGNGQTISGTYSTFKDDGKTELRMNFPLNSPLYELTDDWYFISNENNIMHFEDSGDILKFEKL
jgi:hypothetical protein